VFGATAGFASAGYQTALYINAPREQLGTAPPELLRTFGYVRLQRPLYGHWHRLLQAHPNRGCSCGLKPPVSSKLRAM
jgi:hypothetical protein